MLRKVGLLSSNGSMHHADGLVANLDENLGHECLFSLFCSRVNLIFVSMHLNCI